MRPRGTLSSGGSATADAIVHLPPRRPAEACAPCGRRPQLTVFIPLTTHLAPSCPMLTHGVGVTATIPPETMSSNVALLYAFIGGAIVGAGASLLFAPEKGEDLRARVAAMLRKKL